MKRDLDLCRQIMLWLEEQTDLPRAVPVIGGWSEDEVGYNCLLLHEAGLIEAVSRCDNMSAFKWLPRRLTYNGHEFLDATRNPAIWKRACQKLANAGLSVATPIAIELCRVYLQSKGILPDDDS